MKTLSITTAAVLLPTMAFASEHLTNKVFVSGPLILLFLGFCAFVVVIQCIPAIIMCYSIFKGLFTNVKESAKVEAD